MAQKTQQQPKRISSVELDALVLVKMVKHCKESMPDIVTGQLLGLDINNVLGVTQCFPFASSSSDATSADATNESEQMELLRVMRDVNMDYYVVGWYQSAPLGSFLSEEFISAQFSFQESNPNAVVIVFDPAVAQQGLLPLHAYRLSDEFLALFREGDFSQARLARSKLTFTQLFDELPITLKANRMTKGLLYELRDNFRSSDFQAEFDRLDLGVNPLVEKIMESTGDCLDGIAMEQQKFANYEKNVARQKQAEAAWLQKRRAENVQRRRDGLEPMSEDVGSVFKPAMEPSRLEVVILHKQIDDYCQQIATLSAQALTKLYMFDGLQKSK